MIFLIEIFEYNIIIILYYLKYYTIITLNYLLLNGNIKMVKRVVLFDRLIWDKDIIYRIFMPLYSDF